MQRIRSFFVSLGRDQRGLSTVEYAIILCLIAAFSVGTWQKFGEMVEKSLGKSTGKIEDEIK